MSSIYVHRSEEPSSLLCNVYIIRYYSWLRHYATSRKVEDSILNEVIGFFNQLDPSSHTMALGSAQPLIEMSTRNLGIKEWTACKADNLTTICEPIV
jgi:hypothetical protein